MSQSASILDFIDSASHVSCCSKCSIASRRMEPSVQAVLDRVESRRGTLGADELGRGADADLVDDLQDPAARLLNPVSTSEPTPGDED